MNNNMPDKQRWLPPAAEDTALAARVNERLPAHGRVTPTRKDVGDDAIEYGMVLEYCDARKPVAREYPFYDPDEVVKLWTVWVDEELPRYQEAERWVVAH